MDDNIINVLPEKSANVYEKAYDAFAKWCQENAVTTYTENELIAFFSEKAKLVKAATLWSQYSMLKATLRIKHNIQINKYQKLIAFLKEKNINYKAKQSKIFTRENFLTFLLSAPDDKYLMWKVCFIFGVAGGCTMDILKRLTIDDIQDKGNFLLVIISDATTGRRRTFTVFNNMIDQLNPIDLYRKYYALRPAHITHKSLFIYYKDGKCTVQPIGIHTLGRIPTEIATYLKLTDPTSYTGHSFKRTATLLFGDTGSNILSFRQIGTGKSAKNDNEEKSVTRENKIPRDNLTTAIPATNDIQNECSTVSKILVLDKNGYLTDIGEIGINEEVATNLVKTWVHKLMQLQPPQQSNAISRINNLLSKHTSNAAHPNSTDDPKAGPSRPQNNKEFVSVSNHPASLGSSCDKLSKDRNYLSLPKHKLQIEAEPNVIEEQLSDENEELEEDCAGLHFQKSDTSLKRVMKWRVKQNKVLAMENPAVRSKTMGLPLTFTTPNTGAQPTKEYRQILKGKRDRLLQQNRWPNNNSTIDVHPESLNSTTSLYGTSQVTENHKEFVSIVCPEPLDGDESDPLDLDKLEVKIEVEPTLILEQQSYEENVCKNDLFKEILDDPESETSNTHKTKRFRGMSPQVGYSNDSDWSIKVESPDNISDQLAPASPENIELLIMKVEPTEN